MNGHLRLAIFIALAYAVTGGDLRRSNRQVGTGVSFAFPALSFLSGSFQNANNNNNNINNNNNNNNYNGGNIGNLFGGQTFTRTLVSTVSTVTTASFRTCTVPVAALMPCAGRRKRSAGMMYNYENEIFMDHETNDLRIEPTASIALIVGSTTLTDPLAVSEYLAAHQPTPNSIIYPPDITISEINDLQQQISAADPTALYPSDDSPHNDDPTTPSYDDNVIDTTPGAVFERLEEDEVIVQDSAGAETTTQKDTVDDADVEKARVGFSKTTVTTIIRVTSVATTLASGTMATLTISYMGCLPPSLPVSGAAC